MKLQRMKGTAAQMEEKLALEWADMLAWTIATSNLLEVDLEAVLLERYGKGCWKCRLTPCRCTIFSFDQVDWINEVRRIEGASH